MISTVERAAGRPSRWPKTIDDERRMQLHFGKKYGRQIAEYAKARLPEVSLSQNQLLHLVMIYYGIYFYDHICGGRILSGETTANEKAELYRRVHDLPNQPINPMTIYDNVAFWPIDLHNRGGAPSVNSENSMIAIPLSFLEKKKPAEIRRFDYFDPNKPNPTQYSGHFRSMNVVERGIRVGIEEAQHSDFWYLERGHFNNLGTSVNTVNGPLKGYINKSEILDQDWDEILQYYAGIGPELAAEVVISEYYRRYFPDFWKNGRREYHEAVMTYRRRLVATNRGEPPEGGAPRG